MNSKTHASGDVVVGLVKLGFDDLRVLEPAVAAGVLEVVVVDARVVAGGSGGSLVVAVGDGGGCLVVVGGGEGGSLVVVAVGDGRALVVVVVIGEYGGTRVVVSVGDLQNASLFGPR